MSIKQQGGVFGRNPSFNIASVEKIGVGTEVKSTSVYTMEISDLAPVIKATAENAGSGLRIDLYGTSAYGLRIQQNSDTKVEQNGNDLKINKGNLVIGTSGKGIDFSATSGTGTSELFDDYEEGTFTPTIIGTTTAGSGTYTLNAGHYTKVGNRVMYNIWLEWTAHTGTGNMDVDGLPFAGIAGNASPASVYVGGAVGLTAGNILGGYAAFATTKISLRQIPTGGGAGAAVPLDTNAQLFISGQYRV